MPGIDVNAEIGQAAWTRADRDGVLRTVQRARLDRIGLTSRRALAGDAEGGNAELKAALEGQPLLCGWVTASPADVEASTEQMRKYAGAANILGLRLDTRALGQSLYSDSTAE